MYLVSLYLFMTIFPGWGNTLNANVYINALPEFHFGQEGEAFLTNLWAAYGYFPQGYHSGL